MENSSSEKETVATMDEDQANKANETSSAQSENVLRIESPEQRNRRAYPAILLQRGGLLKDDNAKKRKISTPVIPAINIISDSPAVCRKVDSEMTPSPDDLLRHVVLNIGSPDTKYDIEMEAIKSVNDDTAIEDTNKDSSCSSTEPSSITENTVTTMTESANMQNTNTVHDSLSNKNKSTVATNNKLQTLAAPASQRQRSKSFSGPQGSTSSNNSSRTEVSETNDLPELTFSELRLLLLKSKTITNNDDDSSSLSSAKLNSFLLNYPNSCVAAKRSPLSRLKNIRGKETHLKLPGENQKPVEDFLTTSIRGTVSATCSPILNRPRQHSQPNFLIPDSIHTAPILPAGSGSATMKFFRPFRRASQVSTVSLSLKRNDILRNNFWQSAAGAFQGLFLTESMASLTHRALVSFIAEENFSGLQHLLDSRRVVVDDRDENGSTALMVAAQRGKANFVRALLEHGADINAEDTDNWTALLFAVREGHDEIVADLLHHGASVGHRDMGGWTSLMWACYKGRNKSAKLLIEKGADVNAYGNYNITCLAWAAGRGYTDIVKDLIQHGAKVNTGDKYGTTPLIWACRKGYIEIVDMLLSAEANVDACGMTSWTPMLVACSGNHVEVVKCLLELKPNINALDKDGCSALTISCKEGFHEIAISLINHGAYININDRGGTSNLIHAAKGGHRSIVEALLKKHADVNVQGKDKKTALYWAVEKSHVPVVKLVLAVNPDLELTTKDGETALMRAVRSRHVEIVSLLLDKRAKVSHADKNGDTCLHIAMRARSKQIVELLLRNPVHSQLLYRPNRAGETPYNIDRVAPKPILPQIFGSRGLNTQEDGENLLGYNLYSSALADMLSDPSLNMPITIGLFARWGSGKSFLLSKLREEMKSFARQWLNPVFTWDSLLFIVIVCFSSIVGVVAGLALGNWIVGVGFLVGTTFMIHFFLFIIWFSSKRSKYDWSWSHKMSSYLATKTAAFRLICSVIFCHPPGGLSIDPMQAQPINFYFTEQTKISSTTGGENSVVQMLGSLYSCIENDYGVMSSRLYRAFRPRPVNATADWKWRKLCCIPYCVIFLFCFACTLIGIVVLALYLTDKKQDYDEAMTLQIIMGVCGFIVGMLLVANLYTVGQVIKSILFSHRRHLQRTVSKMYAIKSEGFLHALKAEVNLMTDMIHCLDAFTKRQSRLVVIVDGLDSGEQEKVLQVLDAVNILFNDTKAPFIILLAIDPHITAKGIEMNINPVLNESNIGGHDYLRNLVHLPFFLQNAALRKVKHVKMLESSMKRSSKFEEDPGPQIILSARRPSVESGFGITMHIDRFDKPQSKKTKRLGLKMSDSVASSLGSNLNRVASGLPMGGGPSDLKKMLLGDDYFSDVNPRSMRRLMNIIHITGRLLKAFSIDFNWYHLSTWVNVTEQWPFRLSWIIIYCEQFQKELDDSLSLKAIFERVRPFVPTSKEIDPNVILDRDEKKLDVYLGLHKGSMLISTLYVFLPFTISLDPQLRKDITEQYQPVDQIFKQNANFVPVSSSGNSTLSPSQASPYLQSVYNLQTQQNLRFRQSGRNQQFMPNMGGMNTPYSNQYPGMGNLAYATNPWLNAPSLTPQYMPSGVPFSCSDTSIPKEFRHRKLSTMTIEQICELLVALTGIKSSQVTRYQDTVRKSNINGRVLMSCDLADLKLVLQMTFGDWEMFKSTVMYLRESEQRNYSLEKQQQQVDENLVNAVNNVRISVTSPGHNDSVSSVKSLQTDQTDGKKQLRPNILEKQVTMEEQMICGALELLNEEAKEDARKGEDSSSTLSPINSEPEPLKYENRKSSKSNFLAQDETDVLYVTSSSLNVTAELPDSPSVVRKLEEAEAKYSVHNEVTHSRSNISSAAISQPISIPHQSVPSSSNFSPGKKHRTNLPRNASMTGTSPFKSKSVPTNKDYALSQPPRVTKSPARDSLRKVSRKTQHQSFNKESSSDASSDESQKPLVNRTNTSAIVAGTSGNPAVNRKPSNSRPPRPTTIMVDPSSSPKKKHVTREDSMTNRFSRIKSSFFGPPKDPPNTDSSSPPPSNPRRNYKPIRYDLPTEDSSEPSQYFKDHGHPWTQYRAPTPLPPFGTDEYYRVIKSSNPSPTTSNESEIGSTPEDISSREDLFLPDPPDMPESPYPRRSNIPGNSEIVADGTNAVSTNVAVQAQPAPTSGGNTSFVPFKNPSTTTVVKSTSTTTVGQTESQPNQSHIKPRKLRGRTVASSGEEAVVQHTQLVRTQMNQSDPVLSSSTTRVDSIMMSPQPAVNFDPSSNNRSRESQSRSVSVSQQGSPLTRQSAFDPGSSRENTPQK